MPLDLTDDETAALIELLRGTIDRDRFPLSPRIRQLRAILTKIEPPAPRAAPYPAPKPIGEPSMVLAKRRGRRR
jgi:hypothetical protein